MRLRRLALPALICTLAAGGTVAFALQSDPRVGNATGHPVAKVPDAVVSHFSAFGQTRSSSDSLGSASRGIYDTGVVPEEGLAIDKSQRAHAPRGRKAWIAPTNDGLCLLVLPEGAVGVGGTCSSATSAVEGNALVTVAASANDVEVYGVVPDGVSSVDLILQDGSSRTLPVSDNTYSATADQPSVAVEFDGPHGHARVDARSYQG
jgi:hypothetical protein